MPLYHIERAQGVSVSWQAVQLNQITKQPTTEFKSINSREYFFDRETNRDARFPDYITLDRMIYSFFDINQTECQ